MSTWQWVSGLGLTIVGAYVGLWWWLVYEPADRRDQVSAAWRDEQHRGRRE